VKPGGRNLRYENPRWNDLKPWLFETYRWFRTLARDGAKQHRLSVPVRSTPEPESVAVERR
jgi:hypothetical protein